MGRAADLTNKLFGKLTAIKSLDERDSAGSIYWLCRCSCGNTNFKATVRLLNSKHTQSCGCSTKTHGATARFRGDNCQLDYSLWTGIKNRCYNKKEKAYKDYGNRGIVMFDEWKFDFTLFAAYIRTLPNCPSEEILTSRGTGKRLELSIDRINNNNSYKPGNLKWSSRKEQNRNKRNNRLVKYNNKQMTLSEFIETYAVVCASTVHTRIGRGWTIKEAAFTEARK